MNDLRTEKLPLRLAVALTLLLPLPVHAASIAADDTVAGLPTVVSVRGAAPSQKTQVLLRTPTTDVPLPLTIDASGAGQVRISGHYTEEAGTHRVSLPDGSAKALFEVHPDRVSAETSQVAADRGDIAADGEDDAAIAVRILDRFGNPLSGRQVKVVSSRPTDRIAPLDPETDERGTQRFRFRATERGTAAIRAIDLLSDTLLDDALTIGIGAPLGIGGHRDEGSPYSAQLIRRAHAQEFGPVESFVVTVDPEALKVGEFANRLTVRAVDRDGRTVENYKGTLQVTSSDPNATLPGAGKPGEGRLVMTDRHLGTASFYLVLAFNRSGEQTLTVRDLANPDRPIEGSATVQVSGIGKIRPEDKITITSPALNGSVRSRTIRIEGTARPYTDLELSGAEQGLVPGETDAEGKFVFADVRLPANVREFTIQVREVNGRGYSGNHTFAFDDAAPTIRSVIFRPTAIEEGANGEVALLSDEKGAQASLLIGDQTIALQENANAPGTYQAFFTAPRRAGEYQPSAVVVDAAGNRTELKVPLRIVPRSLAQVTGLRASPRANAVELAWDPVSGEQAERYRIYVAKGEPKDFLAVETADATPTALVTGLQAGTAYHFAVTAVIGQRESGEKSAIVAARPAGLKLETQSQVDAVQLRWAFPDAPKLSAYVLEYGVDPGAYVEKRLVNGQAKTFTARDLLPGITYHFRLTPVTTTGEPLADLAVAGEGKPLAAEGGGFHASPSDPLPVDPSAIPPSDAFHQGAPATPGSGIPGFAWWAAGAAALGGGIVQWKIRKSRRMTAEFLRLMEKQYRS